MIELLVRLSGAVEEIRSKFDEKYKQFYTVEDFGALVGRAPYTIRNWITTKRLNAIRVEGSGPRGRLLIPREELNKLVATGQASRIPDAALG